MATIVRPVRRKPQVRGIRYVSRREGAEILDRQANKYLGLSGV